MKKVLFTVFMSIMLFSCVSQKKINAEKNILILKDSYCKPPEDYNYVKLNISYNSDSIINANAELKKYFSDQSILILNALGTTSEVEDMIKIKNDSTINSRLRILELKNIINNKITIVSTELNATAAEYDCEGERVDQMANYVQNINDKKNNFLIMSSIITGAATSIAGGIIKNNDWQNAVGIGGGIIGAGLGLATFNPKGRKIEFRHERNLLRDVWNEKLETPNFPPFIWYMFTEKKFANNEHGFSILQNTKQRWLKLNFDNDMDEANSSIVFSDGGKYTASDLRNRAIMLNQMQSVVRTIFQNINYLLLDLDKLVLKK
ncbi:hypothetical protein [Chishuiella sp.]|uniref:hypothetical protein n=1 Tax=Chishuiella sp. TaxID=1969467 RepID=UPI0028AC2567|nr:hypothetical protein [Chishuiella sp.]